MSDTIPAVYISTFERTLRHLAQQSETKLLAHVMNRAAGGKDHAWERLGSTDAELKSTRLKATPVNDGGWSRRLSVAKTWHNADSTEAEDVVQMLIDPNSNIAMSLSMSIKRAWDAEIIEAATGTALDGDGTTAIALPPGQIVGAGYGSPISFDAVTEVQEIFMSNNIDPDIAKVFVVGPKQIRKLMQLTENTSADYVQAQALQRYGVVPNWMGFTWIYSTLLNIPGADQIDCFAMTMRGVGFQMNREMKVRVAEDPSVSFAWRIYVESTFGAVRVEDEHVVKCEFADLV